MSLDPAVAAVRLAVRRELVDVRDGGCVLVACSGGADSLALLAATVFELRRSPVRAIGVVVDHGLQDGSDDHTSRVVAQMARLGVDETASIRVRVDPGPGGVEAGAREARYAALQQLAQHFGAETVLLGHTRDDQAETVLLGLTRGSGGRSVTGMRRGFFLVEPGEPGDGPPPAYFSRPLLDCTREQTEAACRAEEIDFWVDPHNSDPRFLRSRVRHDVLPVIERELGPGVSAALARTGEMLRDDLDALDDLADEALVAWRREDALVALEVEAAAPAVRNRVVRRWLVLGGVLRSDLTREHVLDVVGLARGAGGREIQLPGHVTARRDGELLVLQPTPAG